MPKGYWIARVDVDDAERYKDYVSTAAPAMTEFGAKFLVRGGPVSELEGVSRQRNVVIEFPSVEAALACYASPAYQAAKAIRQEVSQAEIIVIPGLEP